LKRIIFIFINRKKQAKVRTNADIFHIALRVRFVVEGKI